MTRRSTKSLSTLLAAFLLIGGLVLVSTQKALASEDVVRQSVAAPFDTVVTSLKRAVTGKQLVVVKEVPFQQMLGMVGVKAEKMMGFEIFHPRYGKVIYENDPAAFKDAPLRIFVRESDGKVSLEYRKPSVIFAPYSGLGGMGKELDQVLADIVTEVAK